jgi:hypothetical protein
VSGTIARLVAPDRIAVRPLTITKRLEGILLYGCMVMLPGSVVCVPALSVTATVKVNVPAVVGVPESPAAALGSSRMPGGSCPDTIDQTYGWTPPSAKKFVWYAAPTVPFAQHAPDVMTRGVGASMVVHDGARRVEKASKVSSAFVTA